MSNLVPYEAQIDFNCSVFELWNAAEKDGLPTDEEILLERWAAERLREYKKLRRYLALAARDYGDWPGLFAKFKGARIFMATFVEIAHEYQRIYAMTQYLARLNHDSPNPVLTSALESRFLENIFRIEYRSKPEINSIADLFGGRTHKNSVYGDLGRRLFEAATEAVSLDVDHQHQANISFPGFVDAVQGVDLRRLKRCLGCGSIFWAYRLNTRYCRRRCSNTYHQRQLRSDPKKRDAVNSQRRMTYQSNKELKEGKERRNRNGTI